MNSLQCGEKRKITMKHLKHTQKKKSLLLHVKRRVSERYGITFGKQAAVEMAALCRCGKYFCHLGLQSLTRSKIVLQYAGHLIPVIYDKKRHCLITVLTMDMLSSREQKIVQLAVAQ